MNKERRKQLSEIQSSLEDLKDRIETLASEERETFDNMPENMQQGERGQAIEQAADNLDSAVSDLESTINSVEEAKQ